eukprot:PITA_08489
MDAKEEEYSSIMTNDVWEVVPRPEDRSLVGSRWIYNIKYAADGSVWKYKARFVAKRFTDADWASSSVDQKSTFGYCFSVGSGMISWCSRKQKPVALSSAEEKYMAANTTMCEAIWLRKLLVSLFRKRMEATNVFCDNQSCIKLFENPVFHDRSKHIDIRCHFIKDCVQYGAVQLQYVPTVDQVVDILTKVIGRANFI